MQQYFFMFSLLFGLIACGNQTPDIEIKKVEVQEDKRNISELQAMNIIDVSTNPMELKLNLQKIQDFHKADFSFTKFWAALRYPNVNLTRIDASNILTFDGLGVKSCSTDASEAYLQFILYVRGSIKQTSVDLSLLKLLRSHFEHCRSETSVEFSQFFFTEVSSWSSMTMSADHMDAYLGIYQYFLAKNNQTINESLIGVFGSKKIEQHSLFITKINDVQLALRYSSFLQALYPLNHQVSFIPLKSFIGNSENLRALIEKLTFDDSMGLLNKMKKKLPLDNSNVQLISSELLRKAEELFSGKLDSIDSKVNYVDALNDVFIFHISFSDDLSKDLDFLSALTVRGLKEIESPKELDELESQSSFSAVAASILNTRLTSAQLQSISLLNEDNSVHEMVNLFSNIKRTDNHEEKLALKNKFCSHFKVGLFSSLPIDLSSGCFKVSGQYEKLSSPQPLNYSLFSAIDIDAKDFRLSSASDRVGIIDLSNRAPPLTSKIVEGPSNADAVVVPLFLGLESTKNKGPFERNSNYYFFYHYVYKKAEKGGSLSPESSPKKGNGGGNLRVLDESEPIYSLISLGGEGQLAPLPILGGEGYSLKFNQSEIEEWMGSFKISSTLINEELLTSGNLVDLVSISKRSSENALLFFLDPGYVAHLSTQQLMDLDKALAIINEKENFKCQTRDCKLQKTSGMAVREVDAFVSTRSFDVLMGRMNPGFQVPRAESGPSINNGSRGKNGKVIYTNSAD